MRPITADLIDNVADKLGFEVRNPGGRAAQRIQTNPVHLTRRTQIDGSPYYLWASIGLSDGPQRSTKTLYDIQQSIRDGAAPIHEELTVKHHDDGLRPRLHCQFNYDAAKHILTFEASQSAPTRDKLRKAYQENINTLVSDVNSSTHSLTD